MLYRGSNHRLLWWVFNRKSNAVFQYKKALVRIDEGFYYIWFTTTKYNAMELRPPYTYKQAEELCNRYKFMLSKENSIDALKICEIAVSPYEKHSFSQFVNEYSTEINVSMAEIFYQEYQTEKCDVAVFIDTSDGRFAFATLTEFLRLHPEHLRSEDVL